MSKTIRNYIKMALVERYPGGTRIMKDKREKKKSRSSWKKQVMEHYV